MQQEDKRNQNGTTYEALLRAKDEKIMGLQELVQLQDQSRLTATQHETIVKEKDEEILSLQELVQLQDQSRPTATQHEIVVKAKDEAQKKAADERTAKDAANAAKTTLQHQLDKEKQASRDARAQATETETKMRNEIKALKLELSKGEERQAHNPVSNQTRREAQEKPVPFVQANAEIPHERVIRTPRALKRPDKPGSGMLAQNISTGGQAGNGFGQSQQTHGPVASQPEPNRDSRRPFLDLSASVTPTSAIDTAPRQEPAAGSQPLAPNALGDNLPTASPERPIRIVRGRGRQLLVSSSANKSKTDNKKPIGQMPAGWMKDMIG